MRRRCAHDGRGLIARCLVKRVPVLSNFYLRYSWVSPALTQNNNDSKSRGPLIHLSANFNEIKCVIGHFVSYDRARVNEEYLPQVIVHWFNFLIHPLGYEDPVYRHIGITRGCFRAD